MKIGHIAVWANDIEALKVFYETYFGANAGTRYVNEKKHYQSYFLTFASGSRLELMQRPDIHSKDGCNEKEYTGYAHIAISAGSEAKVDELTARLVHDGYILLEGPRHTGDGCYESVILDPEGNRVELTL